MPKVPTLSSTPTSSTAVPGVDSAAASGSQVWNGHSGALIAKAAKNPRNSHFSVVGLSVQSDQLGVVEGARAQLVGGHDVQRDQRRQHQQAAEQAVEQELHRGVRPLRAAVGADQEVDRDQHRLEEDVEQEHVGRREDADDHRLEDEDQCEEVLDRRLGVVGLVPAGEDHDRHEDGRHRDEDQRDAVDADRVRDAEAGDPAVLLDELELRAAGLELGRHGQCQREDEQRDPERYLLGQQLTALGQAGQDQAAQQGEHTEDRQPREAVHVRSSPARRRRQGRPLQRTWTGRTSGRNRSGRAGSGRTPRRRAPRNRSRHRPRPGCRRTPGTA